MREISIRIIKVMYWLSFCLTITLLIFHNHYLLGTLLCFGEKIFALILVVGTFIIGKSKYFIMTSILMLALLSHFFYEKHQHYTPTVNTNTLAGKSLKLMTYNIFFKNSAPSSIVYLIEQEKPDIIALQELTPNLQQKLNQRLQQQYPYQAVIPLIGTHGLGIYAKYPLVDVQQIDNKVGRPIAQIATVQLPNARSLKICNMHLASPAVAVENPNKFWTYHYQNYQMRQRQYQKIASQVLTNIDEEESITVLLGDFNTMRCEPLFNNIRKEWQDSFDSTIGFNDCTFPNSQKIPFPFITLDYVLFRGNAKTEYSYVLQGGWSDHLAVVSSLQL